ncbi:hypothetical protein F7984_17865 [Pradoshia sp. D12]|uniref:hypothetical protein n=1 Tax=Bacillaceae TaxID=186817 RepID=UPI0008254FD6|nr:MULTISPECIES: hypothetical protein [Bacillaceae]QFK72958.1 hypothetical protein F7984_17865 [Pradoshia sp. D12]TPF71950.1 hypothetical protein FHY44_10560 [Bacillus sp. D12]
MNEREVVADLIRIVGSVNSRVSKSESDLRKIEQTLQILIKELSNMKELQYQLCEQTYQLHEH